MYAHVYSPKCFKDIKYHPNICNDFKNLAKNVELQNMILYGPPGSGKKTICKAYLNEIFGSGIYNVQTATINEINTKVEYIYSNFHIEIDLSLYKGNEKIILHKFIKSYASTLHIGTQTQKIIVFLNAHLINKPVYNMLRKILEITTHTARYIFIAHSLSAIPSPILSRLFLMRFPMITHKEAITVLKVISKKENIVTNNKYLTKVIKNSYKIKNYINLHDIIHFFQLSYKDKNNYVKIKHSEHKTLDYLIKLIKHGKNNILLFNKIREIIIERYINLYPSKNILYYILHGLLDDETIDDTRKHKIINLTAECECSMSQGNKDILFIEHFIYELINYLH